MKTKLAKKIGILLAANIILALAIGLPNAWSQGYAPGEILVKFKAPTKRAEAKSANNLRWRINAKDIKKFAINNVRQMKLHTGMSVQQAILEAYQDPNVEYAEPNYVVDINATPNDTRFNEQWGLHNTGQFYYGNGTPDADIDAPEAWNVITDVPDDIVIAVIDTGIDYTHEDLADNMWHNPGEIPDNGIDDDGNGYVDDYYGYDFCYDDSDPYDSYWHGTSVAGIIAAVGNNGIGVTGVCWKVKVMAVKSLNDDGWGYISDVILGIQYAVANGAKILNNSYGSWGYTQALKDAIIEAHNAGVLFVSAVGNKGIDIDTYQYRYPSSYDVDNIISVTATNNNDNLTDFSNYGLTSVDLAAPGKSILSTMPLVWNIHRPYSASSGTSMAAPHISGICALIWAKYPELTHLQVKERLLSTVDPKPNLHGKMVTGGRANLYKALTEEKEYIPPAAVIDLAISGTPIYQSVTFAWTATGDDNLTGTASGYDLRYSTSPIDETNFESATIVKGLPYPKESGSRETFTVSNLNPDTTYYFAIKVLDNWGNKSDISNIVSPKTDSPTVIFYDDMENGLNGWTVSGTDGRGGPSLWHLSSKRYYSSNTSWYYGDEKSGDFKTGSRNYGSITSPAITVPSGATKLALMFNYWRHVESYPTPYDDLDVEYSSDNGSTWTEIWSISATTPSEKKWLSSGYINLPSGVEEIMIRFTFDTIDATWNFYEGIYIDDIKIIGAEADDYTPPGGITDLTISKVGTNHLTVSWTSTGDDGNTGKALSYDVRYSTNNITTANWKDAIQASGEPVPQSPGSSETFTIVNLTPNTKYYIAIKAMDNSGNESTLSNIVCATTTSPPQASVSPSEMPVVTLEPNTTTEKTLTITNNGSSPLDFSLIDNKISGFSATTVKVSEPKPTGVTVQSSAPDAQFAGDRILVKFKEHIAESSIIQINSEIGTTRVEEFRQIGLNVLKITSGLSIEEVVQIYKGNPNVEYVEPDYIAEALYMPNDPKIAELYGLNNTGQTNGTPDSDIDAPEAWNYFRGGERIVIAVLDSGVDYKHEDLAANMWHNPGEIPGNGIDDDGNGYKDDYYGYDFFLNDCDPMDDYFHGTHVAGIIGAVGNNSIGVTGVNWNVKIMPVKFLDAGGYGYYSDAIKAILYAVDMGAKITSNSWGGSGYSQGLYDAIEYAKSKGCIVVAAAGNSGKNADESPLYPAAFDLENIISVAATDHNDNKASFSNYGPASVDLGAPGVDIISTMLSNSYGSKSGTSMACPYVAGACALIWNQNPQLTYTQVKERILSTVDPIPDLSGKTVTGGRLNIYNAVQKEDDTTPPADVTNLAATGKTLQSVTLTWTSTGDDGNSGKATLYDLRYSTSQITADKFVNAIQVEGEPEPKASGCKESVIVTGLDYSTLYYFALKVMDNVGNWSGLSNVAGTTTDEPTIIFQDDVEDGTGNWTGNWSQTSEAAHSSSISWTDSPGGYYGNNQDISLTSPTLDLSKVTSAYIWFWHKYDIEEGYDYGCVEVSTDSGSSWTQLKSYTGNVYVSTWEKDSINLTLYTGKEVKIRFRLVTDSSVTYDGWYIDDIVVLGSATVSGWLKPNPLSGTVPANSSTTIILTYDATGMDPGSYSTELNISTNDPNNNLIIVPAYLKVEIAPPESVPFISIISPSNGAILKTPQINVSGTIDYNYSAVTINGVSAVICNSIFNATIGLSEGINTIKVTATNSVGSTTKSIIVTRDTTPPAIIITSPADGYKTAASSITVSGTVNDNIGISQVTVNSQSAAIEENTFTVNGITLDEDANTILAQAVDTVGNTNSGSITVIKDTTPPQLSITSPPDGATTYIPYIDITGTIDDNEATVKINDKQAAVSNNTFTIPDFKLSKGENIITVTATDTLENTTTLTITVSYYLGPVIAVIPITLPEVTLDLGETTTQTITIYNEGDLDLSFSISASGGQDWLSLGLSTGTLSPGEETNVTLSYNTNLTPGEYTANLNIYSNDNTDNPVTIDLKLTIEGSGGLKWYVAEGCTAGFDEYILVMNPNSESASVKVTFMKTDGSTVTRYLTVNPTTRYTIYVNEHVPNEPVSAVVESTNEVPIIVERSMYWDSGDSHWEGGHCSVCLTSLSQEWYLAEGCTDGFDEWVLILNPNSQKANVTVTFMKPDGNTVKRYITVGATSRYSIYVNAHVPNESISTKIESTLPIAVERAMYWDSGGYQWVDGHVSTGITEPAQTWYLAEGCTDGFDEWVLIMNPNNQEAYVTVTFMKPDGTTVEENITVGVTSRYTIYVNDYVPGESVSTKITSDQPVVVERAMYWDSGGIHWRGGHNSPGTTNASLRWDLAEGYTGGSFDEWILIMNPNSTNAEVKVTFMKPDGSTLKEFITVLATSRYTIHVNKYIPNEFVSTTIESLNNVTVIVERAMYWDNSNGNRWAGGHASIGVR